MKQIIISVLIALLWIPFTGVGQVETDTIYLNDRPYYSKYYMNTIHLDHKIKKELTSNPEALHEYNLARACHSTSVAFSIPTGLFIIVISPLTVTWSFEEVTHEGWIALGCLAGLSLLTIPVAVITSEKSDKHLEKARKIYNDGLIHRPEDHIVISLGPTKYGAGMIIKF